MMAGYLTGDGHIEIVETELPITISSIDRNLSAPSAMSGTITNAIRRLKNAGRPVFEPRNTVILAEASGFIRGLGIYQRPTFTGANWALTTTGLGGYPMGQPYLGEQSYVEADPLDIYREIWANLQSQPRGNLGVTIDDLQSPVRVGSAKEDVAFTTGAGEAVSFEAGPRKLNFWQTLDCGRVIDDYAKEAPFDWLENPYWLGDEPRCHIDLGYPTIGARKDHLSFVLGENLATEPGAVVTDFYNEVHVLGAGEGRDRIRGFAAVNDGRLRWAKTVEDKSAENVAKANAAASALLARSRGDVVVESLEVYNHPNAPLEGVEMGDEVLLQAETQWNDIEQWVRVVGRSEAPGRSDVVQFTVVRSAVT